MIYPIRTITAGVGTLEGTDPIIPAAVQLAEQTGAVLNLVHSYDPPIIAWNAYAQVGGVDPEMLNDYFGTVREQLEQRVRAVTSSKKVRSEVVSGPSASMLLVTALRDQADLIVVGHSRGGKLTQAVLGTTAQRVLRESTVPVLVLRQPLPDKLGRVLLTTDLSEFSAGIHELGLDVIESLFPTAQAELRSLHVVIGSDSVPFPYEPALLEQVALEATSRFIRQRRSEGRKTMPAIRFGEAAKEISAEVASWKPDLLVLGTHARKGATRWLLGSVSEAAIREATTNVLVVPAALEEQRTLPVPTHVGAVQQ